ncbi:hypothetical protein P3S68_016863 [Capsicum galapagoense]
MVKKTILPKHKDSTASDSAGSSRKRKAEAIENVSKKKKIQEAVSELDSKLKEISDYVESSEDVAKCSVSGDSEESEGNGRNSDDEDNDPLSVSYLSRCISVELYDLRTIIDEVRSFLVKISVRSRMRHEMWFCVNNKPACFGLKEFCLITRLNYSLYPSE